MNTTPNPTALTAEQSRRLGETEHRNVFCGAYNLCLDMVMRKGWNDWTCSKCANCAIDARPGATTFAHSRPAGQF